MQLHYVFLALLELRHEENGRKLRMNDHGMRLIVYGVAGTFLLESALLSMNFLQYSLAFPVMAWVCLLTLLLSHAAVLFRGVKERHHSYLLVMHYTCLLVWYAAILGAYLFNAYS